MNRNLILCFFGLIFSSYCLSAEVLENIDVTQEESDLQSSITAFDTPVSATPLSLTSYDQQSMKRARIEKLSDISTLDAGVTDSYNSSGYWDIIAIRGFTLDNRSSFQREGLPINGETSVPLENKERIDVLKGLSNLYSGAASPGGLVNYVVKRPTSRPFQTLRADWSQQNNQLVSLDVNRKNFRFNAAQENIQPLIRNTRGDRSLLAGAFNYQFSENSRIEYEAEWSRRSQPSVPGFSLLGNKLPSVPDPNLNLNNQIWSKPVVFEGLTGSIKYTQIHHDDWVSSLTLGGQRLNTDDRLAFPYGCSREGNFDRYCSDGTFDLYDYRSENEKRETNTIKVQLEGKVKQQRLTHHLSFGGWLHTAKDRMNKQAYNFVGEGSVTGGSRLPPDASRSNEGTDRDSSQLDFFSTDRIEFNNWNLWLGARNSHIKRKSQQTDGSRSTQYAQSFLLPWSALSYQFPKFLSYISYGEGIESFVTPNRIEYRNKGQYLPDIVSRQWELGLKGNEELAWNLALFQMNRPVITDLRPEYRADGQIRQLGLEGAIEKSYQSWHFGLSYMRLDVKRENSKLLTQYNGRRPVNVPDETIRSFIGHELDAIKGLRIDLRWLYEGRRAVLNDNSIFLPAWNRWEAGLVYTKKSWSAQLYIENLFLRRYWKESPTQYGHVYLFPGTDRTVTFSMQYTM